MGDCDTKQVRGSGSDSWESGFRPSGAGSGQSTLVRRQYSHVAMRTAMLVFMLATASAGFSHPLPTTFLPGNLVIGQGTPTMPPESERQLARAIYKEMVEINSGYTTGATTPVADAA